MLFDVSIAHVETKSDAVGSDDQVDADDDPVLFTGLDKPTDDVQPGNCLSAGTIIQQVSQSLASKQPAPVDLFDNMLNDVSYKTSELEQRVSRLSDTLMKMNLSYLLCAVCQDEEIYNRILGKIGKMDIA